MQNANFYIYEAIPSTSIVNIVSMLCLLWYIEDGTVFELIN